MHLVCDYPYCSCLCTFCPYHPYLLFNIFSCFFILFFFFKLRVTCVYNDQISNVQLLVLRGVISE